MENAISTNLELLESAARMSAGHASQMSSAFGAVIDELWEEANGSRYGLEAFVRALTLEWPGALRQKEEDYVVLGLRKLMRRHAPEDLRPACVELVGSPLPWGDYTSQDWDRLVHPYVFVPMLDRLGVDGVVDVLVEALASEKPKKYGELERYVRSGMQGFVLRWIVSSPWLPPDLGETRRHSSDATANLEERHFMLFMPHFRRLLSNSADERYRHAGQRFFELTSERFPHLIDDGASSD